MSSCIHCGLPATRKTGLGWPCCEKCYREIFQELDRERELAAKYYKRITRLMQVGASTIFLFLTVTILSFISPNAYFEPLAKIIGIGSNFIFAAVSWVSAHDSYKRKHPQKIIWLGIGAALLNLAMCLWNLYRLFW